MKKSIAVSAAVAALLTLSGCYKTDWENEKKRADALSAELNAAKETAQREAAAKQQAEAAVNQLRTGTSLVQFIDGKEAGRDGIKLGNAGYFVKHGPRIRGVNAVNYANGALADGPFVLKREASPNHVYVSGNVRANRPDGEWIWNDTAGKPQIKQTFAAGKLVSAESATVARDGKVTWKKLDAGAAKKSVTDRARVFVNIPELIWE